MWLRADKLIGRTPESVRNRTSNAKVTILEDTLDKPGKKTKYKCRSIYLRVKFNNNQATRMYHSSVIRVYGSQKDAKNYLMRPDSQLWVHCRCAYFLYYCEQALFKVKATSLYDCRPGLRSKDPKVQRNPNLTPYVCKHLYAAIVSLIRADARKGTHKDFINKQNPFGGDYDERMPPSYTR